MIIFMVNCMKFLVFILFKLFYLSLLCRNFQRWRLSYFSTIREFCHRSVWNCDSDPLYKPQIGKRAHMRLFQFLKRGKQGARKNSTMGTRVEMWGNDLWSISIKKRTRTTSEQNISNKLAMLFFYLLICL